MRIKTLDKFILKSYLGPFVLTFFITNFILLMQFLWLYIDDLVGKGLGWVIITKFMVLASITLIPLGLPLAILLSSIMTFGNLAEHYELAAMKSCGLSLQKIMRPLIITTIIISISAFYFSNDVLPFVNLKMGSLLWDIRQSKPALNIQEGVFYDGISGYSIRVEKKDADGKGIQDVMIYDHTANDGNTKVILAKSGKMELSSDKNYLILTLRDGNSYEEVHNSQQDRITHPMLTQKFGEEIIRFDLSGFKLTRTNEDLFKSDYQMMNVNQLSQSIDSIKVRQVKRTDLLAKELRNNYLNKTNLYIKLQQTKKDTFPSISFEKYFSSLPKDQRLKTLEVAANIVRSSKVTLEATQEELSNNNDTIVRDKIEWNKKFTLSFACLVLFFIGAPLGAIIRKGGLGMPTVVSIIFFVIFWIISIMGEKFAKQQM
ncbi:MAG TPA: LptF/LptG family permease, partial [Bacteroidia bacterium]|nr:LptF/LptG family permease [Bacteroidia bacterium]